MSPVKKTEKSQNLRTRLESVAKIIGSVTRVTGLLLTVISMHILVIRPLVQRVDDLQSELHDIEVTLSKVAAEQTHLHSTNDLLSELKTQHDAIAGARATLQQMQKLREEIEIESNKIPEAMEAVSRISELPDHLHQSELERYTTLVKPVPNPYQNLSKLPADEQSRAENLLPEVDNQLSDAHKVKKVAAPPFLFISGIDQQNVRRFPHEESKRMIR